MSLMESNSYAYIRLTKNLEEDKEMKNVKLVIPDQTNIQNFRVSVKSNEGLYKDKWVKFNFKIPNNWPIEPPRVTVVKDIFHPQVGEVKNGGVVSLSILHFLYKPSITISSIALALQFILINIMPYDAMNIEASELYMHSYNEYVKELNKYIEGFPSD